MNISDDGPACAMIEGALIVDLDGAIPVTDAEPAKAM